MSNTVCVLTNSAMDRIIMKPEQARAILEVIPGRDITPENQDEGAESPGKSPRSPGTLPQRKPDTHRTGSRPQEWLFPLDRCKDGAARGLAV